MKDYNDYVSFMKSQVIYLKEVPYDTIQPVFKENEVRTWSTDKSFGEIGLKANINGPVCPEKFFHNDLRITIYLKESFINRDSWFDKKDRGGHKLSIIYGLSKYEDLDSKTYKPLVQFCFYLIKFLKGEEVLKGDFIGREEEAMEIFRNHICILNACWFPHVSIKSGNPSNLSRCIDWLNFNGLTFKEFNELFGSNLIIGTKIFKTPYNEESKRHELFGIPKKGILSPSLIKELTGFPLAENKNDGSLILEDNKLYLNTYHPSSPKFKPYENAITISKLYSLHKNFGLDMYLS